MENNNQQIKLRDFAFTGNNEFYFFKLAELTNIAEKENWTTEKEYENGVLKFYIDKTFERAYINNHIIYSNDKMHCCFNTGLLSKNFEIITAFFKLNDDKQNPNPPKWYFLGFVLESDRDFIDKFDNLPPLVKYYDNFSELIYDPTLKISINNNHIIDHNWDRFPQPVKDIGKLGFCHMLQGILNSTYKLIERNHRIAVPQFYNNKIMFLVPLNIPIGDKIYTMALAVEQIKNQYRANTILPVDWAYSYARLIAKPENSWLLNE